MASMGSLSFIAAGANVRGRRKVCMQELQLSTELTMHAGLQVAQLGERSAPVSITCMHLWWLTPIHHQPLCTGDSLQSEQGLDGPCLPHTAAMSEVGFVAVLCINCSLQGCSGTPDALGPRNELLPGLWADCTHRLYTGWLWKGEGPHLGLTSHATKGQAVMCSVTVMCE